MRLLGAFTWRRTILLAVAVHLAAASAVVSAQDAAAKPNFVLSNYSLYLDGAPVAERVGTMGGSVLWFMTAEHGLLVLSATPHEGHKFEKAATLSGNTITFTVEGKRYQVVSDMRILADGGGMELWVMRDAGFVHKDCGTRGGCFGSSSDLEYVMKQRKQ